MIRDEWGRFVAARGCRISGAWRPSEAETIGLKEALSWIIARGLKKCVLETDSYILTEACKDNPGRANFGTIVMECI